MVGMNHRVESEFVHFIVESLRPLGPVTAKRMFGGHGLFLNGVMFGLIVWDTLYFKVDEINRPDYEVRGLGPFAYVSQRGQSTTMSYNEAPHESLDDPEILKRWASDAYAAALREQPQSSNRTENTRTG